MGRVYDFIANTADGVFAVDRRQSIVLWNRGATRILGYPADEVIGKKCYGVLRGRDGEGCTLCRRGCDAFSRAECLEMSPTLDLVAKTKEGSDVWLNLSTMVVPSRRQDLSVLVHLFREVTREHHLLSVFREFADVVSDMTPARKAPPATAEPLPPPSDIELTRREHEILTLLATGVATDAVAEQLCISPRTVRNHINNILGKLSVHSRLEAVSYSIKNGLL